MKEGKTEADAEERMKREETRTEFYSIVWGISQMGEAEDLDKANLEGRVRGGTPDPGGGDDGNGGNRKFESLKEIFSKRVNPGGFEYDPPLPPPASTTKTRTRRTNILRITPTILIQLAWKHAHPPPHFT